MSGRTLEFDDAYRAFYSAHSSVGALLDITDGICSHRVPIHGGLLALNATVGTISHRLHEGRRRIRGFKASSNTPCLIEVPFRASETSPHGGTAKAFLLPNKEDQTAWLVGLREDFYYLWAALQLYLRSDIAMMYLKTHDFRQAFRRLSQESPGRTSCICGYTANVLCDEGERVKTRREWFPTEKSHADFFAELEQEKQWLRSVEIVVHDTEMARGRLKRELVFSCRSGFRLFLATILKSLREVAAETRGIFQCRAAADSPTHTSRPIQISYDTQLFEDKLQNRRLIRVLRQLPDSALSVFHPNPFLHATIIDYSDGSSYTIWIMDNSAISIIPGLRATLGSLGRLCNHINEHFGEGQVKEG
jgi:hypothetical protein